jgi:hypothetical protein
MRPYISNVAGIQVLVSKKSKSKVKPGLWSG